MCSPFFVYHSVVFQYLAETHLCPVCEMISLTFVLPASRLQHSVRLGTAGFSMSGKKGTDIEALGFFGCAVSVDLFPSSCSKAKPLGVLLLVVSLLCHHLRSDDRCL